SPAADSTAPQTTISSGPEATGTVTSASFAFIASETGSSFSCKLDSGSWAACASPKGYTGLAVGPHTFAVRATDASGNVDSTPSTQTWTVEAVEDQDDTTAPQTSIA